MNRSFENTLTPVKEENTMNEFSNDLLGVEICAAIKNIYSMIIGASEGLNSSNIAKDIKKKYYLNTAASLMHKAINEMVYFTKT